MSKEKQLPTADGRNWKWLESKKIKGKKRKKKFAVSIL